MKTLSLKKNLKYFIAAALALSLLSSRGMRNLIKNYLEYRRLEQNQRELKLERIRLEETLKTVKNGVFIEHAARKELGLARKGELEYRFPPPKEGDK